MKYHVSRPGLFAFTAMWAFSFYVLSSTAIAQPDSTSESRTENSVVKLDAPVVQRLGVTSGFGSFIPNRWGVLSAEVSNPTDRSQKLTIRANWETDNPANNAVQFTRTFVVPAMTRRVVWYPIRVPDHEPENERLKIGRLMLRSIISREEDGKEVMVLSPLGKIHAAAQINTEFNKPAMGFIPEDETELLEMRAYLASRGVDVEDVNSNTLRMLIAIRDKQGLGSAMFKPKASGIAPNPLSLDGLDQLVIADGSYSKDVSLTDSIRSWIMSGGRAWIMLDRTGTAFAQRLLGDTLSLVELETQQLNRVVIIDVHDGQHHVGAAVEYDQPVKLLTVLVENVDVTHEVNGVPAAFWLKYGNGEILFTTLSSEAWTRPKAHPSITTALLQREPLEDLMKRFYTPTDKALTDFSVTENEIDEMTVNQTDDSQVVIDKKQRLAEFTATSKVKDIDGFLKQKVGFQIVSREHIMVVFGLFCALIVGLGYFLHRKGRMELLLAGGPVIVIVLSSYLYIIGAVKRSTLDSLTASVQFINAEHGSRDLVIRGMGAVYSEESVQENIEATAGGVFWPDMQELTGTNIRMVWTDMDRWHWEGLMMPGGTVRTYPFEKPLHLNEAIQATATLSPQGLVGTYRLPGFENLEHAILVSPTGERAQVDLIDGKLMVHNEELSTNQLDSQTKVLDGEAIRRLDFIKSLLSRNENQLVTFPTRYTLLFWSSPWDMGFSFPGGQTKIGSSLTAIPLHVENTAPGASFYVPSIYQQYDVLNSNGLGASIAYDNENKKWFRDPHNAQHLFWLRTKVPASVLPASITRATVMLDISAGGRPVNAVGASMDENGRLKPVILDTTNSPNTVVPFVFEDPQYLKVDPSGNLYLGINVGLDIVEGESLEAMQARDKDYPWFIRDVDVILEGKTLSQP